MKSFRHITPMLPFLFATGACSDIQVGSSYLKSATIPAAEGGRVEITAADSEDLAGTSITVSPYSFAEDTLVGIGIADEDVEVDGLAPHGPRLFVDPADMQLAVPAQVALPFYGTPARSLIRVHILEDDGTVTVIQPEALKVDLEAQLLTFTTPTLGVMQSGGIDPICGDVECPEGEVCMPVPPDDYECVADPCADVVCPEGEVCDPAVGDCVPSADLCLGVECPVGATCDPVTGVCVELTCDPVECEIGELCHPIYDECVATCLGALCDPGEVCGPGDDPISSGCVPE